MDWLNYHHLKYFWIVAREGSFSRASKALNLTQPTLSKQIKSLEEFIGEPLFIRKGSGLELTHVGKLAQDYANDIFQLGDEFLSNLKGLESGRPKKLRVGSSEFLPKLVCHRILRPVLKSDPPIRIHCEEGPTDRLLAELSIQHLDLVLADAPISGGISVKAFNHLLGECGLSFFATDETANKLSAPFPACLHQAPMLLPSDDTALRRSLDSWFKKANILPSIVAEFHDSALMKVFGRESAGIFPAPSVVEDEVCREYGVRVIGSTEEIKESFYAITVERKLNHPIVMTLVEEARTGLFGKKLKD